jgi:hypothetical protein
VAFLVILKIFHDRKGEENGKDAHRTRVRQDAKSRISSTSSLGSIMSSHLDGVWTFSKQCGETSEAKSARGERM